MGRKVDGGTVFLGLTGTGVSSAGYRSASPSACPEMVSSFIQLPVHTHSFIHSFFRHCRGHLTMYCIVPSFPTSHDRCICTVTFPCINSFIHSFILHSSFTHFCIFICYLTTRCAQLSSFIFLFAHTQAHK